MTGSSAPVRDDLCRAYSFTVRATDDAENNDGLTLDGYGAVFNAVTQIDSWEGTFEETIAPGAFRKSLRERMPKLQFDHGYHPLIGSIPIGRITEIGEDDHGLRVIARLSDNWLVEPIRDAIRDEAIEGMSFRFSVVREEWVDADGKKLSPSEVGELLWNPGDRAPLRRTLKEVKVAEVGPVVWPAYEETSVGVRSQKVTIDLARLRDPAQRSLLARAVLMADAAERSTRTDDAPPVTETPEVAADEHTPADSDTPRSTEGSEEPPAGEHKSASPDFRARIHRTTARFRDHLSLMPPSKEI